MIHYLRYEPLRKQLNKIKVWPHTYIHKIIGKNKEPFKESVLEWEKSFSGLKQTVSHESNNATYLALTYEYHAQNSEDIIALWVASEKIKDIVTIL